jgi:holliday junction DNA helicase RuvB
LMLKSYRHLGVNGPARAVTPELPIFDDDGDET